MRHHVGVMFHSCRFLMLEEFNWRTVHARGCVGAMATIPVAFRYSRERAELETANLGPLRPAIVNVEWACNNLEPLMLWIVTTWINVRKRVRKLFSHYGALEATSVPKSGRDPQNRVYSLAITIAGFKALDENRFYEVSSRNLGSLGDLFESILGYAWWLQYRPEVFDFHEFCELLRSELNVRWRPDDFINTYVLWEQRYELLQWAPWIEQIVQGCEVIYNRGGLWFQVGVPKDWAWAYEALRMRR